MDKIYFDYNAGAPLRPELRDFIHKKLTYDAFLNPSSPHQGGQKAKAEIENTRSLFSTAFAVREDHVIFTSSGSEANNLALHNCQNRPCLIAENAHDSLRFALTKANASLIKIAQNGLIDQAALKDQLAQLQTAAKEGLQSPVLFLLWVHNENGLIEDIEAIIALAKLYDAEIHLDCVQGIGKLPLKPIIDGLEVGTLASISLSGHKLGGLAGVGAYIYGKNAPIPFIGGGGQERNRRAGTENYLGILSFGEAFKIAIQTQEQEVARLKILRDGLENGILAMNPKVIIIGKNEERIANTSQFIACDMPAARQLIALDLQGIMVSAGSACSSGKMSPSPSLLAQGFSEESAASAIRVSLGYASQMAEMEHFLTCYRNMVR